MLTLRGEHIVASGGVQHDALIEISGSQVVSVEPYAELTGPEPEQLSGWVVPGFIDTHVHGGGGSDYATDDAERALGGRAFHAAYGTTTSLASLVAAPLDVLCRQLALLGDLTAAEHFAGVHLEGPFLSPDQRGAHNPAHLRSPDPASVERLIEAGQGALRVITMAPELMGGLDAIRRFVEAGVTVAVGHTDAQLETVEAAIDAGATVATHLFNAMRGVHHREPGPVPVLLDDGRVRVELIADGFHLHPEIIRLATAAAGSDRVMLVTDAMVAAGMPDGDFSLGGLDVRVVDGLARLVDRDGHPGSIAGSTLTMAGAFELMTGIVRDIPTVAAMASTNAARQYGWSNIGVVEAGGRADLCLVDDHGVLQRVMQSGQWLAPPVER